MTTVRESAQRLRRQKEAADELTERLKVRLNVHDWTEVKCPREGSYMSPCVARNGGLAVADVGVCVYCGATPSELLATEKEKHP